MAILLEKLREAIAICMPWMRTQIDSAKTSASLTDTENTLDMLQTRWSDCQQEMADCLIAGKRYNGKVPEKGPEKAHFEALRTQYKRLAGEARLLESHIDRLKQTKAVVKTNETNQLVINAYNSSAKALELSRKKIDVEGAGKVMEELEEQMGKSEEITQLVSSKFIIDPSRIPDPSETENVEDDEFLTAINTELKEEVEMKRDDNNRLKQELGDYVFVDPPHHYQTSRGSQIPSRYAVPYSPSISNRIPLPN